LGGKDGSISGTPLQAQTLPITISYSQGDQSGSSQVILSIFGNYVNAVTPQVVPTKIGLVIQYPSNLVFVVDQTFKVPFTANGGAGSLVWAFHGLPAGINGDVNHGYIQGAIAAAGYYNVQADCADVNGNSAQAYITLNVQPKTSLTSASLIDVSSAASSTFVSNAEAGQVAADTALIAALSDVNKKKAAVNVSQAAVAVATFRVSSTQSLSDSSNLAYQQASNDLNTAQTLFANAQNALDATNQNLGLAKTNNNQYIAALATAKQLLAAAQDAFNAAQKQFNDATVTLNNAKANVTNAQIVLTQAQTAESNAEA
jgi:hypothetical protein